MNNPTPLSAILLLIYLGVIIARWFHPATFTFATEITVLSLALVVPIIVDGINIRNSPARWRDPAQGGGKF
jgi:uncharacterized protein YjeT (DUF2065 family)